MKFYFLKSVYEKASGSSLKLKPLPGQTFESGAPVDPAVNVAGKPSIRMTYPVGTVFGCSDLASYGTYYRTEKCYPVNISVSELKEESHRAPEDMQRAYEAFVGITPSDSFDDSEEEEPVRKNTYLNKMKKNASLRVPDIITDGFYVNEDVWYLLLRNIRSQVNTLMIGPTGTGKTELVMLACKKLGIDCSVYDMGAMYDPVAGLLGVHRLQEGGVSLFDYAKFTKDISKPGVVLLDELSRAPVTTNNILFPCLDSRRSLPVEIAGGKDLREIKVHEDCCFIATANIGAEYTGTMEIDRALQNRFFPLELSYLPPDEEVAILKKRCHIGKVSAGQIVSVANTVRELHTKQEISCSISTRETLMAAELVADGWSVLTALELSFLPLFEGTKSDGERSIVLKIITSR